MKISINNKNVVPSKQLSMATPGEVFRCHESSRLFFIEVENICLGQLKQERLFLRVDTENGKISVCNLQPNCSEKGLEFGRENT